MIGLLCLGNLFYFSCENKTVSLEQKSQDVDRVLEEASRLLNSGRLRQTGLYIDSAFQNLGELTPADEWQKHYFYTRLYLFFHKDNLNAQEHLDSMLLAIKDKEAAHKKEHAQNFFSKGDLLKAQKRYQDAMKYYFDGREFARKYLNECETSDLTYQLGLFKYTQRQYKDAIPLLRQAYKEVQTCPQVDQELYLVNPQKYINTLALAFEKLGQLDSAAYHYERALAFLSAKREDYPQDEQFISIAEGVVLGNLGGVNLKLGNWEKAEELLLRSIEINDRPRFDRYDAQTAKLKLIDLYLQSGKLVEAQLWLDELDRDLGNREVKNEDFTLGLLAWKNMAWRLHEAKGDWANAFEHLKKFQTLFDSLERAGSELRYTDMEEAFRKTENEYLLSIMNRDQQIKKVYLTIILLLFFSAGLVILLVNKNLKKTKQFNMKVSKQNLEMQDTLTALEQSQAENTRMMHMVAHDLRSPISSMTMLAELLIESNTVSEEEKTMLEHIKASGHNSLNLVSDILGGVNEGEQMRKEAVDLQQLLQYCVDLMQHKAEEKQQKLILKSQPVSLKVSREKMWRVISNLIGNAIKFSPKGEEIIIKLLVQKEEGVVRVSVSDQGIGIPEEIKEHVFEMFSGGKRTGTAGEQPHGMGLAISKQIVQAHGGQIWFESNGDRGTVFFVEIPM